LMHNKILFAQPLSKAPWLGRDGKQYAAWAYVGSANLSESAWGRLVRDRTTKQPKLNCRNWECGVVVPVPIQSAPSTTSTTPANENGKGKETGRTEVSLDVFRNIVPVPMLVPGEEYGSKRPWFYTEQR